MKTLERFVPLGYPRPVTVSSFLPLLRRAIHSFDIRKGIDPRRSSILIHGVHSQDWMAALAPDAPVWGHLRARKSAAPARKGEFWRQQVVVPLMETHIVTTPRPSWSLTPSAMSLAVLADKGLFADFAETTGLSELLPLRYTQDSVRYPAVLKRTDLNAGSGIAIVASPDELEAKLHTDPWAGHRVELQEFVPAAMDLVAYVVCVGGRVRWSRGYAYQLPAIPHIRGPVQYDSMSPIELSASEIEAFESILLPLRFDGPANIDYRRRQDGRIAIMEINPRLGGTLMRPECAEDLAECLATIVRFATWRR